jgi:hypothetical protein
MRRDRNDLRHRNDPGLAAAPVAGVAPGDVAAAAVAAEVGRALVEGVALLVVDRAVVAPAVRAAHAAAAVVDAARAKAVIVTAAAATVAMSSLRT